MDMVLFRFIVKRRSLNMKDYCLYVALAYWWFEQSSKVRIREPNIKNCRELGKTLIRNTFQGCTFESLLFWDVQFEYRGWTWHVLEKNTHTWHTKLVLFFKWAFLTNHKRNGWSWLINVPGLVGLMFITGFRAVTHPSSSRVRASIFSEIGNWRKLGNLVFFLTPC